jgi:peroxiredoxin Q/BCP
VFGVSKDSLSSHQKFVDKQNYKHNLISDEDEKLCQLFGVMKEKSMYGRTYWGIDRSTFIIDSSGVLKAQWNGVKVNGHVQEVLAKVAEIK